MGPRRSTGVCVVLRARGLNRSITGSVRRKISVVAAVALYICIGIPEAHAQSEDQIKAAFLFNFARYVEWPASAFSGPEDAVKICMAGAASFADVVTQTVSGKSVENRPVAVTAVATLSGLSGCHILYVGDDLAANPAEVAASVSGSNVFTVADRAGFARGGGIANFIRANKKIRFEINPSAAKKAGLKVSSRLLRLAKVVK